MWVLISVQIPLTGTETWLLKLHVNPRRPAWALPPVQAPLA